MALYLPTTSPSWVLDWNVIQSKPKNADWFGDKTILVPETAALECLTKEEEKIPGYARVLEKTFVDAGNRAFVGRNIFELFKLQYDANRAITRQDLIDQMSTQAVRKGIRDYGRLELDKYANAARSGARMEGMEELRKSWVGSCKRFSKAVTERHTIAELRVQMQNRDAFRLYLANNGKTYAKGAAKAYKFLFRSGWIDAFGSRPMSFALGRWMKITLCYAIRHAINETRDFENNFDDAQYILLATYAGYLVTSDGRLIDVASDVSPNLIVWNPRPPS